MSFRFLQLPNRKPCPLSEEDEYILLNDELKVFFYRSNDLYKDRQLVIEYDGSKLAFVLNSEDAPNFYKKIKKIILVFASY